jgi:lipopolysaccharide biosynthesis glycosyltransferase
MQKNIKILISCHKETDYVQSHIMKPIQVGCANSKVHLPDMLHDDQGDNISELNPLYCELTAQYWAWKNLDADYYGFCHYRRYFNFSETQYPEDKYGNIIENYIDQNAINKYALKDETIQELVPQYDIITVTRKDVRRIEGHFSSIIDQYKKAPMLNINDLFKILDIIDKKFPQYSKAAHKYCEGHVATFCNMYILRKDIFFHYCEWLFTILQEFCKCTDMSHYSTEALRTPGHLAERLFGIYLLYLLENNSTLKIKELQCVLFEHTEPQSILHPAFSKNSIPVVFAASNNYVPIFAACLQSIVDRVSPKYNYDFVLLQRDVTDENKKTLLKMLEKHSNISLRFFNVARLLANYDLKANAHISVETFFRFLIQDILPDYDKVIYLDCDLIVNADIAELYNIDIEGYMLAATRDPDFLGQINGANKSTQKYCKEKLCMINPYNYFQAGVLLLNSKEMRRAYSLDEWLTFASHPYLYNDQDVLNIYCENHVKYLDMAWNCITDCDHTRVSTVISFAPDAIQKEYKKARNNPKIIHYAGFMKPWHRPTEDYAHYFWKELKKTPYYEEMLFRLAEGVSYWQCIEADKRHGIGRLKKITKYVFYKIGNKLFPKGTTRRERLKRLLKRS